MTGGDVYSVAGHARPASPARRQRRPRRPRRCWTTLRAGVRPVRQPVIADAVQQRDPRGVRRHRQHLHRRRAYGDRRVLQRRRRGHVRRCSSRRSASPSTAPGDIFIADNANNRSRRSSPPAGTQLGPVDDRRRHLHRRRVRSRSLGRLRRRRRRHRRAAQRADRPRLDAAGNVYISDTRNNQVREVAAAPAPQWGQVTGERHLHDRRQHRRHRGQQRRRRPRRPPC